MKWAVRLVGALAGLVLTVIIVLFLVGLRPSHGKNSVTIEINRPAAQVWPYLTEDGLLKKWIGGLVELQHITPGDLRAGSKLRLAEMYEGQRTNMELTVTGFEPNRRLSFTIQSIGDPSNGFTEEGEYVLVEQNGHTRLTLSAQSNYYGLLPRLFEPLITPAAQKKLEGDVARLKTLAESEPPTIFPAK